MSKENEKQLIREIEKLENELDIVIINVKISAAHLKDGAEIYPSIDELIRIKNRLKIDIKGYIKDTNT